MLEEVKRKIKEHNVYCVNLQLIVDMQCTDPILMVKFIIELRWRVTLNYLDLNHSFLSARNTHTHMHENSGQFPLTVEMLFFAMWLSRLP